MWLGCLLHGCILMVRAVAQDSPCCPGALSHLLLPLWASLRCALTLTFKKQVCGHYQKVA